MTRQSVSFGQAVTYYACPTCLTRHGSPGSRQLARYACSAIRPAPATTPTPLQMPAVRPNPPKNTDAR